jgi:hypothetical protein
MDRAMFAISKLIDLSLPTTVGGHSLGGQRSMIAAAMLLEAYQPNPALLRIVSIAGPAAGFQKLQDFLGGVSKVVYRNAYGFWGDGIPLLPGHLPPTFAYVNPPITHITASPQGFFNQADPVKWHNSALYAQGIAATSAQSSLPQGL